MAEGDAGAAGADGADACLLEHPRARRVPGVGDDEDLGAEVQALEQPGLGGCIVVVHRDRFRPSGGADGTVMMESP